WDQRYTHPNSRLLCPIQPCPNKALGNISEARNLSLLTMAFPIPSNLNHSAKSDFAMPSQWTAIRKVLPVGQSLKALTSTDNCSFRIPVNPEAFASTPCLLNHPPKVIGKVYRTGGGLVELK